MYIACVSKQKFSVFSKKQNKNNKSFLGPCSYVALGRAGKAANAAYSTANMHRACRHEWHLGACSAIPPFIHGRAFDKLLAKALRRFEDALFILVRVTGYQDRVCTISEDHLPEPVWSDVLPPLVEQLKTVPPFFRLVQEQFLDIHESFRELHHSLEKFQKIEKFRN